MWRAQRLATKCDIADRWGLRPTFAELRKDPAIKVTTCRA